ncbi:pimeloyl-ACP methyl ester carboxylesterase [Tamilnaduibacter salinus]|uniref:Pimeloyl-ACP methyl ester carboxylesterase n=1 Tax=Tamilnaduibacter salinus TaxID=1484056 RepID=A0A2A2I2Y3_9GAMM|nr:alpha/beta hydrolase [Tamilnaduibacter salinus]PAV25942.1 hypothetical protein CF392_08175 [Tamilnaduibacter salinus]PVY76260.1 pimeloyl-ACP methyl ester carboxylesterase [Tamilnaduibacter salinus]
MAGVIAHDGARLRVREVGRGPVVILLHGFGMESRHWLPIILPLAHRFRFVLPDLRGFGGSSHLSCSEDCVLTSHARDLDAVIRHYSNGDPVGLGGISLGASTSLRYMQLFGLHAVRHYVHIDQAPRIAQGPDWPWGIFGKQGAQRLQSWWPMLERLERTDPETPFASLPMDLRRQFYDDLAGFMQTALSKRWMKWMAGRLTRVPALAHQLVPVDNWFTVYQHMRAYAERDYDFRPFLSLVTVPTTVVAGRHSEMYPWEGQARMTDLMPRARLVTLEKSGHVPLIDQPLACMRTLARAFAHD